MTATGAETHPAGPRLTQGRGGLSRRGLLGAAAVISLGNILSRVMGLVREQVIAASFGATAHTDAYVIARTVPLILYDLLVGSVIAAAFVPVFVQLTTQERRLWQVVSAVFSLALVALLAVTALGAFLAEPLVWVLAGGFAEDQRELGSRLLRIGLISVVFQGLAGVLTSVLYAQNRMLLPSFAVAVYNLGVVVGVLVLAPTMGVESIVVGLVLGALGQFLLQAAGLARFWRAYRPLLDLSDPAVRSVLRLYVPVAAGMVVTVAGYVIDRNLASQLPSGTLSAMQYATTLIQFPLGMVGLAIAYAVLPTLSRFGTGDDSDPDRYRSTLHFGLRLCLLLMLPALAAVLVLAQPIVAVLFERGAFTSADTELTARILAAYAPQLPLTAIDYLLIAAFYARHNTRTPVIVGVVATLLYLVVALALLRPLGAVGLALADATKNSAHGLILLFLLRRAVPGLRLTSALSPFLLRALPAAALAGGVVWLAWPWLRAPGEVLGLTLALLLGGVTYAVLTRLFGLEESRALVALVRARLVKAPPVPPAS